MTYYSKESKSFGYVVYAIYGFMSHIIMNENGVVFGINPIKDNKNRVEVFDSLEEANKAKDSFYNQVSKVIFISEFERDTFTHES